MPKILPGETDLYAITDEKLSGGRSLLEVATYLLSAGIRILQYREKKKKMRQMLEECRMLRRLTQSYDACLIVDDYVEIACLSHADGVHIGQEDLPIEDVRSLVGNSMLIGVSTHSPEQALAAYSRGADYIGVGPVFATKTKEDVVDPVGLEYVSWVTKNLNIPFVAIGGIKEDNIRTVVRAGAQCCALVSEFVQAPNIVEKVTKVRAAMHTL